MTCEVPAEARQARREARAEQQRRRADRARRAHDQPGAHAMLARRPLRRRALRSGRLRHDAYVERLVGADPQHFKDFIDKGWLPKERAAGCAAEFQQVREAFSKTVLPFINQGLIKKVQETDWLK